jgi:hypothetical protein
VSNNVIKMMPKSSESTPWPCTIAVGRGTEVLHRWKFSDIVLAIEFFLHKIADGDLEATREFFNDGVVKVGDDWIATDELCVLGKPEPTGTHELIN